MFPVMSDATGLNATLPRTLNSSVSDSEASRNSVVEMALSLLWLMGTWVKDRLALSKKVPPGGYAAAMLSKYWCGLYVGSKEVVVSSCDMRILNGSAVEILAKSSR